MSKSTSIVERRNALNLSAAEERVFRVAQEQARRLRIVKAVGPWHRPEYSERHRRSA